MTDLLHVIVPAETVNDESVRIVALSVSNGQAITKDQLLVEVETSKALLEIDAPSSGYVWLRCEVGDDVRVGALLCVISQTPEEPSLPRVGASQSPTSLDRMEAGDGGASENQESQKPRDDPAGRLQLVQPEQPSNGEKQEDLPPARLTAHALTLVRQLGIDSSRFRRGTLVRSRDVLEYAAQRESGLGTFSSSQALLGLRCEKLSRRKSAEARLLAEGQAASLIAHVTVKCPIAEFQAKLAARNMRAAASAILILEAATLLRHYSVFNAVYCEDEQIGIYEDMNIGWAVDDGHGLLVPVIAQADSKTLSEIEAEMQRLLAAYVKEKLSAKDLRGATFTISDLSGEGASSFAPLVSGGQSSILGIGTESLTLAFDHRLADGRTAARFLNDLKRRILAFLDAGPGTDGVEFAEQELYCSFCSRGSSELKKAKAMVVRCEFPRQGWVCSLCLAGY